MLPPPEQPINRDGDLRFGPFGRVEVFVDGRWREGLSQTPPFPPNPPKCDDDGGTGIGAGHRCKCIREFDHPVDSERPHGCSCGALWGHDDEFVHLWTIYLNPSDYEQRQEDVYVVRRWMIGGTDFIGATEDVKDAPTLKEARALLPWTAVCLGREAGDDPNIVESWI